MISVLRLFRLGTRVAAWATPYVQEWHRNRHMNRTEGERNLAARNYSEAEKHLVLAIAEAERRRYSIPKKNALELQLAEAQRGQGKLDEAARTAQAAFDRASGQPVLQAKCLETLAEIHDDRGDHPAAAKIIGDALKLDASDPQATARRTRLLASVRHKQGSAPEALQLFEKSVALHESAYGTDHLETGNRLSELGLLYHQQGRHDDAQRCLRGALRIHEARCGADSHQATQDLANLAASLQQSGDLDGAVAQYERAMRLKERMVGVDLEEFAEMQVTVARLYIQWHRYGPARELMAQAMGRLSRRPGPRLTAALETMADLEDASGRHAEAEALREQAHTVTA